MRQGENRGLLFPAIFVMAVGEFFFDWWTPLGVSDWVVYFIPLLFSAYVGSRNFPFLLAGLFSILTLAGFYLSPPGGVDPELALMGRLVGMGVFWGMAALITQYKKTAETLRRTERALKTISECDKVLVHATSEPKLLENICRVITEIGGYRLVWVGFAENDAAKSVRYAARAGCDEGYLEQAKITWADTERGRGPTGIAIRTGQIVVCNDFLNDLNLAVWREAARERGFASSMVLPLQNAGKTFGVLTLYAGEVNAFNPTEVELLKDLADDLAYGIQAQRAQAERQAAEAALNESEQRFRAMLEQAPMAVNISRDGISLYANRRFGEMFKLEREEQWIGRSVVEYFAPQGREASRERIRRRALGLPVDTEFEAEGLRTDGTQFPMQLTVASIQLPDGAAHMAFISDITERKRAAEHLDMLKLSVDKHFDGAYWMDTDNRFVYVNNAGCQALGYAREELLGSPVQMIAPRATEEALKKVWEQLRKDGFFSTESVHRRKDGSEFPVEIVATHVQFGSREFNCGFARDITERKQAEENQRKTNARIQHLNQILHAIQNVSHVLNHEKNPQELLTAVCESLVKARGYVTVWVGQPEAGSKKVRVAAHSGVDSAFLQHAAITWDDSPLGQGPTGIAMRERRVAVFDDIANDPRFAPWRDAVVAGGSASVASIPILHGERLWGVLTIKADRPKAFDSEELVLLLGLAADVARALQGIEEENARRQAEGELRKLSRAVEHCPVSIVITDADGSIEYVNPKFTEVTGYSFAEALGQNPKILKSGHAAETFYQQLWQTISAGHDWRGEFRNKKKNGEMYWEMASISPITDAAGKITGYVAVKDDITRDKQADEKIHEQAEMLNLAHDAINIRDLDHRILYWNRSSERIFGWTNAEAVGQVAEKLLQEDSFRIAEARRQMLEQGYWLGELTAHTKAGHEVLLKVSWTLVRDAAGRPKSIFATSLDITESRKLEQQVARTQRIESLGTLASGVAHDLNNILTPIMVSIGLLKEQTADPMLLRLLASLDVSTQRGAQLVKQILTFGRGVKGERIPLNLREIAHEIQQLVQESFPKNIQFEIIAPKDLWLVIGDHTQIHQIFLNLAINARDAMPDGGKLTFTFQNHAIDPVYAGLNPEARPGPNVLIQITDTGLGMTPEIIARIFDPFYTTKAPGQGTGLGLSTSLGIVKSHGGFINVYSEPGQGSTFKIYLPAKTSGDQAEQQAVSQSGLPCGQDELILFVDDEVAICSTVKKILERHGYRVLTAANGAEAVSIYAAQGREIAIVITDMHMPIMDGPATIIALQTMTPHVKIIGSSGLAFNDGVAKATGSGVRHFVPKPYTAEKMLRTIREVLDQGSDDSPAL